MCQLAVLLVFIVHVLDIVRNELRTGRTSYVKCRVRVQDRMRHKGRRKTHLIMLKAINFTVITLLRYRPS